MASFIEKKAGYIERYDDLKPGDILLFRPPKKPGIVQNAIMFLQSLVGQSEGHFDTTHAAICVGKDEQGKAMIAHLTGHNIMGWKKEPLGDMIQRDGGERAFVVYRPNKPQVADAIAASAGDERNTSIKWKIPAASGVLFRRAQLDPARQVSVDKEYAKDSFCSKFVVQAIKIAAISLGKQFYEFVPNIRSSSTPKSVEAYLYKDRNYEMLVHCGNTDPYSLMVNEVNAQIARLNGKKDASSIQKGAILQDKLEAAKNELDSKVNLTPIDKAIHLLKNIKNDLLIETSYNMRSTTKSYRDVMAKARGIGIFERDVSNYEQPEQSSKEYCEDEVQPGS